MASATTRPGSRRPGGAAERERLFDTLGRVAAMIQQLLGASCEVVLHDFADLEHSIVCIEGNVSGRSLGGAATDLLLSKVRDGGTDGDLHNYTTSLPGGRLTKSGSVFLRDESGKAYGAFCVNLEISQLIRFRKLLDGLISSADGDDVSEMLSDDIHETLQELVAEALYDLGEDVPLMSRESKVALVARLEQKGAFQVKRSMPIVADLLGLSRATLYNYLREARAGDGPAPAALNGRGRP